MTIKPLILLVNLIGRTPPISTNFLMTARKRRRRKKTNQSVLMEPLVIVVTQFIGNSSSTLHLQQQEQLVLPGRNDSELQQELVRMSMMCFVGKDI